MLSKSPVIDLQSILNPAPHTPWSPPLLFVTVPQGRETNDVPFQNIYWRIVASQCCLVVAVQQSESAIHIHAPLLFQSFFPFRSRLPWWLRWFSSAYNAGDPGYIPGWEVPLEKGMATHASILAWKIPWTEKPGRLQSMGLKKSQIQLTN